MKETIIFRDKDGVILVEKKAVKSTSKGLDVSKMVYESLEKEDSNHRVLHPVNR